MFFPAMFETRLGTRKMPCNTVYILMVFADRQHANYLPLNHICYVLELPLLRRPFQFCRQLDMFGAMSQQARTTFH